MFEKIEDVPRTQSGALRNPWIEIGIAALTTAVVQSFARRQRLAMLALDYTWQKPVLDAFVPELVRAHNERMMDEAGFGGEFEDANPDDAKGWADSDPIADLRAALAAIKKQYDQ